ncbi:MAG: hypothetical protein Q9223_001096 [Gallowayella weberi]
MSVSKPSVPCSELRMTLTASQSDSLSLQNLESGLDDIQPQDIPRIILSPYPFSTEDKNFIACNKRLDRYKTFEKIAMALEYAPTSPNDRTPVARRGITKYMVETAHNNMPKTDPDIWQFWEPDNWQPSQTNGNDGIRRRHEARYEAGLMNFNDVSVSSGYGG